MRGDARDMHPPRAEFYYPQRIVGHQTVPCRHLHGEEVCGRQDLPVELQELPPTHASLASCGRWVKVVAPQDVPHGHRVDVVPKVGQRTLDASIASGRILFGHADDQLLDLFGDTRLAKVPAMAASVELLRGEAVVPAQEGIWGGNRGDLLEAFATDRVCERCKTAAFRIGQAQPPAAKLGFEEAILCLQVGNYLLLVTLKSAGEHGE
jgi:hypothetical protein